MRQRHGVRGAERDDVRVGGEQVVDQARTPRGGHRLLREQEVRRCGIVGQPSERPAGVSPPVDQPEADHVDEQHAEACQQQVHAVGVIALQHRHQQQDGVHHRGHHEQSQIDVDDDAEPVAVRPRRPPHGQRDGDAGELEERDQPDRPDSHRSRQPQLDGDDDQHEDDQGRCTDGIGDTPGHRGH